MLQFLLADYINILMISKNKLDDTFLGVVNANFSKFSVIATHSAVYVSFGWVNVVRTFFGFIFGNIELEAKWIKMLE